MAVTEITSRNNIESTWRYFRFRYTYISLLCGYSTCSSASRVRSSKFTLFVRICANAKSVRVTFLRALKLCC